MTWAGREFSVTVDASPSRRLVAKDLEHLQAVGDRSPDMSDLVMVYDPVTGRFTAVFQLESMFVTLAAPKAVDCVFALFATIGIGDYNKLRIDNVHVDSVDGFDEYPLSREAAEAGIR